MMERPILFLRNVIASTLLVIESLKRMWFQYVKALFL